MLPSLAVLVDVGERRERVPDVRGADAERRTRAVGVAPLAIGLAARGDEVAPADAVLVQQVGDVRPGVVVGGRDLTGEGRATLGQLVVDAPPALRHRAAVARARPDRSATRRRRCGQPHEPASPQPAPSGAEQLPHAIGGVSPSRPDADDVRGLVAPELVVVDATRRVSGPGAPGGPLGDLVQVRRKAPRRVRLEHVVVEHEVLGVRPVVRDLARVVITHYVRRRQRAAHPRESPAAAAADGLGLADEPVHQPAVDVRGDGVLTVRTAAVDERRVVERAVTASGCGVGQADREVPVAGGNPVGARIRAEVRVERAVLLDDHHHVADLVDADLGNVHRVRLWRRARDARARLARDARARLARDAAAGERRRRAAGEHEQRSRAAAPPVSRASMCGRHRRRVCGSALQAAGILTANAVGGHPARAVLTRRTHLRFGAIRVHYPRSRR